MQILTQTVRWSIVLLLVVTPWFFGGVWASVQWVLMFVGAVLLALDLVTRFGDDDRPNLVPSAWLPVLLGIALGLFQLVPWSPPLAETLAPASLEWRRELTSLQSSHDSASASVTTTEIATTDNPSASATDASARADDEDEDANVVGNESDQDADVSADAETNTGTDAASAGHAARDAGDATGDKASSFGNVTRSLYPAATREYLALLTLGMAIFVLASVHLVDRQSVVWFFGALGICGAAMSFFGLVQRLSWNGKFYWVFEPMNGGVQSFGPFVNRNNAGGFLNLCLAAGIGLLVWLHREQSWTTGTVAEQDEKRRGSRERSSRSQRKHAGESSRPSGRHNRRRDHESASDPPTDLDDDAGDDSGDAGPMEPPTLDVPGSASPAAASPATGETAAAPDLMSAYRRTRDRQAADESSTDADADPEIVPSDLAQRYTGGNAIGPQSRPQNDSQVDSNDDRSRRRRSGTSGENSGSRRGSNSRSRYAMAANPVSYGANGGGGRGRTHRPWDRLQEFSTGYFGDFDAPRLGSLAIVGCIAGGVLCTASRGSILAMFAAAMVTVMVLAMRRGNRGYAAGVLVMLVAGVGLMSWSGQTEFVQSRFQELFENEQAYESGRLPNWEEALHAWPDFKVAGTGLGTYRLVYERYQQRYVRETVHTHAENQFIQSLVEGGGTALGLLLLEILLTSLAIVRLYRTGGPINNALAIAGTYGLTSQFVGGLFDFGLYIPSNTLLMAALCGIVIGRAALLSVWPAESLDAIDSVTLRSGYQAPSRATSFRSSSETLHDDTQTVTGAAKLRRSSAQKRSSLRVSRSVLLGLGAPSSIVTLVVGFLLLGCLFGSLEMNKASRIQQALRSADLENLSLESRPEVLVSRAAPLQTALPLRWDDAEAHRQMAELLIQQYRAATYQDLLAQQMLDAATAAAANNSDNSENGDGDDTAATDTSAADTSASADQPAVDPSKPPELIADLWLRSSVHHLHGLIHQLQRDSNPTEVDALRQGRHVTQYLVPAARHLLLARAIAPTVPQVHYLLAELSAALPDVGEDEVHLERTHLLAPGDAELWYWSGVLDLGANRIEKACQDWNTSLLLSPIYADSIVESVRGKLTVRQLFSDILPPQADLLLYVIQRHFGNPEMEAVRKRLLQLAAQAIPNMKLPPKEFNYVAARIYNLQDEYSEAEKYYEQAIAESPTALHWRYEYTAMLIKAARYQQAIEQATYLARVEPQNAAYQALLKDAITKENRKDVPRIGTD